MDKIHQSFLRLILVGLNCYWLTSCAHMLQSRTFIDEMDADSDSYYQPGEDFAVVSGDEGKVYRTREDVLKRTPASALEKSTNMQEKSLYEELYRLESNMDYKELSDYEEFKEAYPDVSSRIYFLNLPPEDRRLYLRSLQGNANYADVPSKPQEGGNSIGYRGIASQEDRELNLGMSKDQVYQILGEPTRIEYAGNPQNENEKWLFYKNGGSKRVQVIFDSGVVNGWSFE